MALGLPATIEACLFDLDGVITQTARVHAQAWKQTFDTLLKSRSEPFVPFDAVSDYDAYVDGKPREEGVRSFLESRKIAIDDDEVERLAASKDALFLDLIRKNGVEAYDGTVRYIKAAREMRLKVAVVSSSRHTTEVLHAARLEKLFDVQVDGNLAAREGLKGKPAPDTYLKAASLLRATPPRAAVYEDAIVGVEAGRAGGFGLVVGVDRVGQAAALKSHGGDIVVSDLAELITR